MVVVHCRWIGPPKTLKNDILRWAFLSAHLWKYRREFQRKYFKKCPSMYCDAVRARTFLSFCVYTNHTISKAKYRKQKCRDPPFLTFAKPQMKFRNGGSNMLIKIVQNGMESEWFPLTKKTHRELMQKKPEAAIVHIEDVYPDSPDAGRVIRLDFRLFTVLTREFVLEELRQKKQDERHVAKLGLDARPANDPALASQSMDEQYIRQEIKELLASAPILAGLTPTQLRRFQMFVEDGKSFREIAEAERCEYSTIKDSVDASKKKIKKFFKSDRSKREFLSD